MKRLSPTQLAVLSQLTSGTGNHLRWEDPAGHLRVYTSGGAREPGDRVLIGTVRSLVSRGLIEQDRLPDGSVTWHPTYLAWAFAERGFRS